ncbi:MAG: peptidylprolyl isomerase [Eubacteriales bacterium]|nr:peptidylprolyl isomerase [Eubacteriales bacterium]
MKKIILSVISIALAAGMLLSGCGLQNGTLKNTSAPDPVVITVGQRTVPLSVFTNMYAYYASSYGVTGTDADAELVQYIKQVVTEMIIEENVVLQMAADQGVTLSDEELAQAQEDYDALMADWHAYFEQQVSAEDDAPTGDALSKAVDEQLAAYMLESGYTEQYLRDTMQESLLLDKMYETLISDTAVTDAELQAYYDSTLADQQAAFAADPSAFEDVFDAADTCYRVNARKVRHILVPLSAEQQADIRALRYGDDDTAADTAAADAKLLEYLQTIETDAQAVRERVTTGGEDFGTVMSEVSSDTGGSNGYVVAQNSTTFVTSFTEGAWALQGVGEVSPLVASDYGYHIITLDEEIAEGAIPLADISEALKETLLENKRSEAYYGKLDAARAAMTVIVDYDALGMADPALATAAPDAADETDAAVPEDTAAPTATPAQ